MNKKYVNEIIINVSEMDNLTRTEGSIEFTIPDDLFWFKGHFPSQPLLPGVVQLNWAIYYANQIFDSKFNILSMDIVKFQCPVLPNDNIILNLVWHKQCNKLEFKYTINFNDNNKIASSGRLTLCQ
ncbi:hydroxymyristoyl-ACP dehydratase [Gilliamella sp. G0441]|uniref:ApeI family dehydratase n=1 Tax=Gilliamella sp. G0441 TaxID=3384760 RepID=UPI003D33E446